MMNVLDRGVISVKNKFYKFVTEEKGEVNVIAIIVLIGIAIALALTFKKQIESLVTTLLGTITKNAKDAVKTK